MDSQKMSKYPKKSIERNDEGYEKEVRNMMRRRSGDFLSKCEKFDQVFSSQVLNHYLSLEDMYVKQEANQMFRMDYLFKTFGPWLEAHGWKYWYNKNNWVNYPGKTGPENGLPIELAVARELELNRFITGPMGLVIPEK